MGLDVNQIRMRYILLHIESSSLGQIVNQWGKIVTVHVSAQKELITGTECQPMESKVPTAALEELTGTDCQPMGNQCTESGSSLGLNVYR